MTLIDDVELSEGVAIAIAELYAVAFDLLTKPVRPLLGLRLARKAASDDFASRSADAISCGIGWPANPSTNPGSGRAR